MNDRRLPIVILLVLAIFYLPLSWMGRRNAQQAATADAPGAVAPAPETTALPTAQAADTGALAAAPDSAVPAPVILPEDTVVVRSGLYRYALSTHGARFVGVSFLGYRSLEERTKNDTLQWLAAGQSLFGTRIVIGADTLHLDRTHFQASTDSLDTRTAPGVLTMTGTAGRYGIELTWRFVADDYRFDVAAKVTGLSSMGGTAIIELGDGFGDTEANIKENHRESGLVTKLDKTRLKRFHEFDPRVEEQFQGPFEWVAVKSKYYVAGLFAADSASAQGAVVPIASARVFASDTASTPTHAEVSASLAMPATGLFGYRVYLGPMEYDRLAAMGHDFDDVNPYGFAFIRPVVRPIAVAIRAFFIWTHETTGLGFGLVIVFFGILVRILLWPLNQKAMRSITGMQAIQPELQAVQERYKEDPARMQQEVFKLYKEHKVNPLGGCWPMLLPYPLLIAVFFVLQNTIELRGVAFLWMPDLSRADPLYIIPVLMAASMFGISWIGQRGLPPNPQAKMMMYMMPAVFLFLFANFASGLNLYYLVQNIAQIPQQLLINRERDRAKRGAGTSSSGKKIEIRTK